MAKYDVYRDADGNPVTLTEDQVRAVWHALQVRSQVIADEQRAVPFDERTQHTAPDAFLLCKSRLLGRMLIDGRPPLDYCPPHEAGAPDYFTAEPDLHHFYVNGWPE